MTAPELSARERETLARIESTPAAPESFDATAALRARASSYLRLNNGTTWPDPRDPNDVQWKLRSGNPDRADLLVAAAMMHAYVNLVALTGKQRDDAIRRIRAAVNGQPS